MILMAQEESVVEEIRTRHPYVDIIFGTHNINDLQNLILEAQNKKELDINVYSYEGKVYENIPYKRESNIKAWVNIMYGCDKFCTYCIVPYTRGKQQSRDKEDILKEVNDLIKEGYKEVTLLGQNVNAYGKDLDTNYTMENLLEDVAKTKIERIRFVTSHPWDFSDKMIEVMAKYKNICPSLHLPVQSGSNKILKLMGRRYTKESYLKLFDKLKKSIPNISISTDIIVGFPKETEEDFLDTLSLCEYCKFDNAYTFIYSKRENTPAATLEDNITLKEKEERLQRLNQVVNKYFKEKNEALEGTIQKVLVEGISEKKNNLFGYTESNKLINFEGDKKLIGKIIDVEVTSAKTWSLDGRIK